MCNAYNEDFDTSLTFRRIGRYDVCPAGTYKVALVVSEGDYHWYRQDADGLWSHKRGLNPVERTDYSGKLIIDPYIADRGDYTEFLGYYAVTPWSESFTANGTVYCYVRAFVSRIGSLRVCNGYNRITERNGVVSFVFLVQSSIGVDSAFAIDCLIQFVLGHQVAWLCRLEQRQELCL